MSEIPEFGSGGKIVALIVVLVIILASVLLWSVVHRVSKSYGGQATNDLLNDNGD